MAVGILTGFWDTGKVAGQGVEFQRSAFRHAMSLDCPLDMEVELSSRWLGLQARCSKGRLVSETLGKLLVRAPRNWMLSPEETMQVEVRKVMTTKPGEFPHFHSDRRKELGHLCIRGFAF